MIRRISIATIFFLIVVFDVQEAAASLKRSSRVAAHYGRGLWSRGATIGKEWWHRGKARAKTILRSPMVNKAYTIGAKIGTSIYAKRVYDKVKEKEKQNKEVQQWLQKMADLVQEYENIELQLLLDKSLQDVIYTNDLNNQEKLEQVQMLLNSGANLNEAMFYNRDFTQLARNAGPEMIKLIFAKAAAQSNVSVLLQAFAVFPDYTFLFQDYILELTKDESNKLLEKARLFDQKSKTLLYPFLQSFYKQQKIAPIEKKEVEELEEVESPFLWQ